MHASVLAWVERVVNRYALASCTTLEVGSLDVNGSVRPFFSGPYMGVDMRPGPGVDEVADAADLPFPDWSFQVVVCTEMLEHDPAFWRSLPEMARVLTPDGVLILTARGIGFPPHDHPSDFWRFTPDAFALLFDLAGLTPVEITADPDPASPGVLGLARKPWRN